MNDMYRIIRDPDNLEGAKVPTMPILIVTDNGVVGEAETIEGAVAILIGSRYLDAEDEVDKWNERVEYSRKETMRAVARNIYAVTYDKRVGIIEENYAAEDNNIDYKNEDNTDVLKIHVETERGFLFSLARLGAINILQKEGCNIMTAWNESNQNADISGNEYIDIAQEFDLDELIEKALKVFKSK